MLTQLQSISKSHSHIALLLYTCTWRSTRHLRLGLASPLPFPPQELSASPLKFLDSALLFSHTQLSSADWKDTIIQWVPNCLLFSTQDVRTLLFKTSPLHPGYCSSLTTGLQATLTHNSKPQLASPISGNTEAHFLQPQPQTCKFPTTTHTALKPWVLPTPQVSPLPFSKYTSPKFFSMTLYADGNRNRKQREYGTKYLKPNILLFSNPISKESTQM